MPYSNISELPESVQELPKHAKEIFLAAFNSAYSEYKSEETAFKVAWSAVKKDYEKGEDGKWHKRQVVGVFEININKNTLVARFVEAFAEALELVRDAFSGDDGDAGEQETDRAVSTQSIYEQIVKTMYDMDGEGEPSRLLDVYHDDGEMYAICVREGKLYRVNLTIDGAGVMIAPYDQWLQVTEAFPIVAGVSFESEEEGGDGESEEGYRSLRVIRQANGRARFLAAACTAYLNRVGEIDSRALFDNFVKRGTMPFLTFYHQGESLRMGQADYVARDGNVLIISGLFDDTPLGNACADGIERDGDYWGTSIGYRPMAQPSKLRVGDIEIDVYEDGELAELSVLPERKAAALFTNLRKEVNRMKPDVKDALTKLVGPDLADEFEARVDATNQRAVDDGLIAREDDTQPVEAAPENDVPEPPAAPEPQPEPQEREVELDEAALGVIVEKVLSHEKFTDLATIVQSAVAKLTEMAAEASRAAEATNVRLAQLERSEADKKSEWLEDVPQKTNLTVTYKPREVHPASAIDDPVERTKAIRANAGIKK